MSRQFKFILIALAVLWVVLIVVIRHFQPPDNPFSDEARKFRKQRRAQQRMMMTTNAPAPATSPAPVAASTNAP